MGALLNIRFKQFIRMLADLGIVRSLIGMVLLVFAYLMLLSAIPNSPRIITGITAVIFLGLHTSRTDKTFLLVSGLPARFIFRIEYVLASLPLVIPLLAKGKWQEALALLLFCLIIPEINVSVNYASLNYQRLTSWVPSDMFEWKSGIRRSYFLVLLLFVLSIVFAKYIAVIPLAILLFSLLTTGFYIETESREMLEVFRLSARNLLLFKLKKQLMLFWLVCAPLLVLFLALHYTYWYVLIFIVLAASLFQIISILLKYALYTPHELLQGNTIIIALSALFTVVPLFIPIPFFWIYRYYKKASSNLEFYLHDFN